MVTLSLEAERNAGRDAIGADVRHVLRDFIARRVGDPHTAEDLTQEVLREGVPLGRRRRQRRRLALPDRSQHSRRPLPQPGPPSGSRGAPRRRARHRRSGDDDGRAVRELAQCLRPLIDQLDPIYREALMLTDLDGLTQSEAARRAGISTSGMKSRVQRGRAQLKSALLECCAVRTDVGGRISGYTSQPSSCDCTSTT